MTNSSLLEPLRSAPHALISVRQLLSAALRGDDLRPVGHALLERASQNPTDANVLMDLSLVLQMLGDRETALAVQGEALALERYFAVLAPKHDAKQEVRVLALMVSGDLMANTPLDCLLGTSGFSLDMLYVTPEDPLPSDIPEHDLLFVAIGESGRTQPILEMFKPYADIWPRPVLNHPERLQRLSRDQVPQLLADLPGVAMPPTRRVERGVLEGLAKGDVSISEILGESSCFPAIVRPVDSHAGSGLEKIDDAAGLLDYLERVIAANYYLSLFVDYRSPDGQFRKLRVVLVEGRAFLCHVGVSEHWMIHYLNAGMADSAEKRREEAESMALFDDTFAKRHREALSAIDSALGLDYVGLDCAETPDGKLLVFEADTAMVVHDADPVDLYPYKRPQMCKVLAAVEQMIKRAASATPLVSNTISQ